MIGRGRQHSLSHIGDFKQILVVFLSQFLKGICGENVSGIISQTKLGDYCKNTLSNCLKCNPDFVKIAFL